MIFSKIKTASKSIYFKITVAIVVSVLIIGTFSSIGIIHAMDKDIFELEKNFSNIITESIGDTIVNQMLFSDPSLIQGTLNSIIDNETILFAYIVDTDNHITYHTFYPYIPNEIVKIEYYDNGMEFDLAGYGHVFLRSNLIYYGLVGRIVIGIKSTNYYAFWLKVIVIMILASLLFIGITIYILSKNLTIPLSSLVKDIENRNDEGFPVNIARISNVKEFNILIKAINSMSEHIKESHSQLKTIFDYSLRTLIIITDIEDNIILFNKGAQNILGYKDVQLINREKYYSILLDTNRRIKKDLLKDESYEEEWVFISRENRKIDINIIYTHIVDKDNNVIGTIFFGQDITQTKQQKLEVLEINEKLRLHKENLESVVESRTHELKESLQYLEETRDQLIESEKMSSLGGLVAGIAHEINTPVGIGVTGASFLVTETEEINKLLKESKVTKTHMEDYLADTLLTSNLILKNLTRASELVQSFKMVAVDRTTEGRRRFLIKEYVNEILLSLHFKIKQSEHKVRINCTNDFYVTSYPGVLSQIITNLIFNSYIHGFDGIDRGVIDISIKSGPGTFIIEHKDNGRGIEPSLLSKIYDPFYTTKRGDGGTGLGLNIVYNMVSSKLNGTIECSSELNKFTTFTLTIPSDDIIS